MSTSTLLKKLSMTAVGATCIVLGTVGTAHAAALFNSATGHYYDFVGGNFTWSEAKADAETKTFNGHQGYLVTITSAQENQFIVDNLILPNYPIPTGSVPGVGWGWIGASDAQQEDVWKWETGPEAGTLVGYTNWAIGEPNNGINMEDYAHIDYRSDRPAGKWNDWNATARQGYYIEYSEQRTSVPEPASVLGLLGLGSLGAVSTLKRKLQGK